MKPVHQPVQVLTEEELEASEPTMAQTKPILEAPALPELMTAKQKINNISQKEEAMHYLGLTRKKYLIVIVEALESTIKTVLRDTEGNEVVSYEPDYDKRKWGAEQAMKLFGDAIQHVDANVRVTHSVEELLNVFEKAQKRKELS